jgi:hypothetical protein
MADAADVAEDSGVSIALTPVQLYAILNGKSISQGELASNTWHEMPLPTDLSLVRYLRTLPETPTRQAAWAGQSHYSQPRAPDCWVPPPIQRSSPPDPATVNRTTAVLDVIGGGFEIAGGALLLLAPDPTLLTKVGGSALALHGADVTQAAIRQLFSGKPVEDYTQMGSTWAARQMGASQNTAQRVGVILDVAVPIGIAGGFAIQRALAIRAGRIILSEEAVAGKAGRISLEEEEANKAIGKEGGHTLGEHVNRDSDYIKDRALNQMTKADAIATRFFSKELAEDAVNDAVRANRQAIRQWASTSPRPKLPTKEFEYDCNKIIGEGFVKATQQYEKYSKVRVVFKLARTGPKSIFIVTAYPIP